MSGTAETRENLIVGGGLAGAMAGIRLAAAGRDVVLVEKEQSAHHKVCGEFLSPEALRYLRQAGVDAVGLGAAPVDKLRLCTNRSVVESRLPFRALALSRHVLDEALLARARDAGCDVRRGAEVQRLSCNGEFREDGVLDADGGFAELADGSVLGARSVFLATGKHDLRGWKRPAGRHSDLVGFKMHWRLSGPQTEALRGFMDLFLFEGGYGGLTLVENDRANLCLVVRRARLRAQGGWTELLAGLEGENRLVAERLAGAEPSWVRPLAVSPIPYGYVCVEDRGMWTLGDQAAVIPSFTGDGMAIALHSGALAAEMYLAGKRPGEYQRALKGQLKRGMGVATVLSRAMVSRTALRLAPAVVPFLAQPIRWIARSTRIPTEALDELPFHRPGFSLR